MKLKTYFLTIGICLSLTGCNPSPVISGPLVDDVPNVPDTSTSGPEGTYVQGCKAELNIYCNDVTPGNDRPLACLYAHEDKLSSLCENALYDSAQQLLNAVNALTYLATECDVDIEKYCANVQPGEGRILACMEPHQNDVSTRCKSAIHEIGLENTSK